MMPMNKKILLDVPYYSQRLDVKSKFWQSRACGVVALAMAMDCLRFSPPYEGGVRRKAEGGIRKANILNLPKPLLRKPACRTGREGKTSVAFSVGQLIREGASIGARDPKHGWIHDGLVTLAKRHGFKKSFRKEFPDSKKGEALSYMIVLLRREIPVLISIRAKSGGHLVLLVGFAPLDAKRLHGFYYHDPDSRSRKVGAYKFISTKNFLKIWKGRIVVVQ